MTDAVVVCYGSLYCDTKVAIYQYTQIVYRYTSTIAQYFDGPKY